MPTDEGDELYPEFQFDPAGKVDPTILRVLAIFGPVVVTHDTIASWLRSPRADLGGRTPVEWLELGHDPEPVIAAAELAAAHLER